MMNFESDERNLPQKISEDIISFILNEHLQPGDKLPNEAHLAKELNIGRSSLREAMKLLASRNIVTIRQGSGTYVASSPGVVDDPLGFTFIPDKKKLVQDLLEVRFLLEPAIAAMSAMGYDAYYVALEALKAAKSTDPAKVNEALWDVTYDGVCGHVEFDENGDAKRDTAFIKSLNAEEGSWDLVGEQGIDAEK